MACKEIFEGAQVVVYVWLASTVVIFSQETIVNSFCPEEVQRVPALRGFWDLKKPALRKIRVSGTVGGPLLTRKPPT